MNEKLKKSLDADLSSIVWDARHSQEVFRILRQQHAPVQPRRFRLAPVLALATVVLALGAAVSLTYLRPVDPGDPVNTIYVAEATDGGFRPLSSGDPDASLPSSAAPTLDLTEAPSETPSEMPTPTTSPTAAPTASPTATPTAPPTAAPTASPTATPTASPTATPTPTPTATPTASPTATPTASPTATPTAPPTATPTASPTATPTASPTATPTASPTATPHYATETDLSTPTPTAVPTPTPTPTPAPTPTPYPTEPPQELATYYSALTIAQKDVKYRDYKANFRQYGDFAFVHVYFRYHDPLPETAVMRIVEIDGVNGSFGGASIGSADPSVSGPSDLLAAVIYSSAVSPEFESLRIEGVDTATGETIFSVTFKQRGDGRTLHAAYTESTPSPTPSAPPVTDSATTPLPSDYRFPAEDEPYSRVALEVEYKPIKYSHYSAFLRAYEDCNAAVVHFRCHDPLPEGAYLRIVSVNDVEGDYSAALIEPAALADAPADLLSAFILMEPTELSSIARIGLECIDPATAEVLFTFGLVNRDAEPLPYYTTNPYPSRPPYNITDSLQPYVTPTPGPITIFPDYNYPTINWGWPWN